MLGPGQAPPPPARRGALRETALPRLPELDVHAIKALSTRVNVLPVIARADRLGEARLKEVEVLSAREETSTVEREEKVLETLPVLRTLSVVGNTIDADVVLLSTASATSTQQEKHNKKLKKLTQSHS